MEPPPPHQGIYTGNWVIRSHASFFYAALSCCHFEADCSPQRSEKRWITLGLIREYSARFAFAAHYLYLRLFGCTPRFKITRGEKLALLTFPVDSLHLIYGITLAQS